MEKTNNFSKLSEQEKMELFKVEELEPRLEMIWDDGSCDGGNGSSCGKAAASAS